MAQEAVQAADDRAEWAIALLSCRMDRRTRQFSKRLAQQSTLAQSAMLALDCRLQMLSTTIETLYRTTVYLRPVRVAYFIPEDDLSAFERAGSFATTQWGGIYNLIVTVRPSANLPGTRTSNISSNCANRTCSSLTAAMV